MTRHVVYDAGVLIAADSGSRQVASYHRRALARRRAPLVPAPVLAQAWRGGPQPTLSRLLAGCLVVPMDEELARQAGDACGRAGTSDVVDATVAVLAHRLGAGIVTGDGSDITRLLATLDSRVPVEKL